MFSLTEVRRESSSLEIHVNPYIDAANTDKWKHVLRILYLNGAVLRTHEDFKVPCLISQVGSIKEVEKSMDLLSGKAKAKLMPLIVNVARIFLPKLLESVFQGGLSVDSDPEQLDSATMKALVKIVPELERQRQTLMGMMIDGALTIADLVVVGFFKGLSDLRSNHVLSGISEDKYENMIDGLRRLAVVEPKLQVSLCPECMNYELTISRYPSHKETCPRCGTRFTSQTLYMFKDSLGNLKSQNSDLPLFISSYLKFRLASSMLTAIPEIYPEAEVTFSTGTEGEAASRVEIDVYIPSFSIGMECKTFEVPFAPMTTERANGIVGNLMKQLRKYVKAGTLEFFLITNLPDRNLGKVRQALEIALRNSQLPLRDFKVVPGDVDALLNFLNGLADRMAKVTWERYTARLKEKLPEPIKIEKVEAVEESSSNREKATKT